MDREKASVEKGHECKWTRAKQGWRLDRLWSRGTGCLTMSLCSVSLSLFPPENWNDNYATHSHTVRKFLAWPSLRACECVSRMPRAVFLKVSIFSFPHKLQGSVQVMPHAKSLCWPSNQEWRSISYHIAAICIPLSVWVPWHLPARM